MSDVLREFWDSKYGKGLMKKASTEKKAFDQDSYYESGLQGPTQDEIKLAHPGGGTDIPDVGPGDAHFETVDEVAQVMEEVARKAPTCTEGSLKGISKKAKMNTLQKLAQIADQLDQAGLSEEADMIDAIIQEEMKVAGKK